jgi:hypothetical protein
VSVLGVVLGPVIELVKGVIDNRAKAKERAQEIDGALQTKKLEQISKADDYAQAFRLAQIQTAGWRPSFWTIVLATPVVMCFVPGLAQYVQQGFDALKTSTPVWFQYYLGMAISGAFGYQVVDKVYEWWKAP